MRKTCDQCGSNQRLFWCFWCKLWQCSKHCYNDHNRREHPHDDVEEIH